jgi:hypothetical protein
VKRKVISYCDFVTSQKMEREQKRTKVVVSLLALAGLLAFSLLAVGGTFQPTAPPAPTMKTLDEVEPRIPIPGSDMPVGTFFITQSGSYYLTGDRLLSNTGIQVDVNDVTIDLAGYSQIGPDVRVSSGIYMNGRSNVEIRNGTVRDCYRGIREYSESGKNHRIIGVRSVSNRLSGIYLEGGYNLY